MKLYPSYLATIILFVIIGLTSCDVEACRTCEGHSEDLSYYRDLNNNPNIIFRNALGEDVNFRFNDRIDNFGEVQCKIGGSKDSNTVTCHYFDEFHYTSDELGIEFIEGFYATVFGEGTGQEDQPIKTNMSLTYTTSLDSTYQINTWLPIDSTVFDQILDSGQPSPLLDTLTNDLIVYYDVFGLAITHVTLLDSPLDEMPTNLFNAIYIKPGIGIVGFETLNSQLFLRE